MAWACDLPIDPALYPNKSRSVAVELVGTSITSANLDEILGYPARTASIPVEAAVRAVNRHVKYLETDSHGYSMLDVTHDRIRMEWYFTSSHLDRNATAAIAHAAEVRSGTNRVLAAPLTVGPVSVTGGPVSLLPLP